MKILVTGSTGCLGRNLVLRLLREGHEVIATGRNAQVGKILKEAGATFKAANLANSAETRALFEEQFQIVYHCAALSSVWGRYVDFYEANLVATQNIIQNCMRQTIDRLIYVSTPSLYFNFADRFDIKETDALATKPANFYVKTKLLAEKAIDEAFAKGLPVITIRPRGIFGPYDTAVLPRIIQLNQQGKLPLIRGGEGLVDLTYVENVVEALMLCMKAPTTCFGKKYNITNGEPVKMRDFMFKLFKALNIPAQPRKIPYRLAYFVATLLELISKMTNYSHEPKLTRYSVGVLSKSQTLNIDAARYELNYQPKYSLEEGINLFAKWWNQHAAH